MSPNPQVTLSQIISGRIYDPKAGWISKQIILTDKQKNGFVKLFGHGCTQRRKDSLRDFIENTTKRQNHTAYDRVIFNDDSTEPTCRYIAGQDETVEIPIVRKLTCGW